jgi:hypothetical protein
LPATLDDPEARGVPDRSAFSLVDLLAELTKTVKFFGTLVHDERKPFNVRLAVADRQLAACDMYAKILSKFDLEQRIEQLEASQSKLRRDFGGEP